MANNNRRTPLPADHPIVLRLIEELRRDRERRERLGYDDDDDDCA
jgi:hypothetical protein